MSDDKVQAQPGVALEEAEETPEIVEKILLGYFSGKRDAVRTYKFLDVEVEGKRGVFRGMAVDISATGMLLRIIDSDFAKLDEMDHLMPYTARVWFHFENGLAVAFAKGQVRTQADVVRVTGYCGRGKGLILIGCRFRDPLDDGQCEALGIESGPDRAIRPGHATPGAT